MNAIKIYKISNVILLLICFLLSFYLTFYLSIPERSNLLITQTLTIIYVLCFLLTLINIPLIIQTFILYYKNKISRKLLAPLNFSFIFLNIFFILLFLFYRNFDWIFS